MTLIYAKLSSFCCCINVHFFQENIFFSRILQVIFYTYKKGYHTFKTRHTVDISRYPQAKSHGRKRQIMALLVIFRAGRIN